MSSIQASDDPPQPSSIEDQKVFQVSTIAKGGGISLFGLSVDRLSSFLGEILLARILGAAGYGTISLARSIFYISYSVTNLGLPQTVIRYGAIYQNEDNKPRIKGLLQWVTLVGSGTALIGSFILFISSELLSNWLKDPDLASQLRILAWMLAPFGLATVYSSLARAYTKHNVSVLIMAVFPVGNLILLGVFSGIFKYGLTGASNALLIASILSAGAGSYFVIRLFPQIISSIRSEYELKQWIQFALPMVSIGFSYELMRQSTRLILGYYASTENVGLFTAANALANNLVIFMLAIIPVFSPVTAILYQRRHEQGAWEKLTQTFQTATRWMLILTLPILVVIWVFGSEVMQLFGTEFEISAPVLVILSLSQLVNVGTGPVGMMLQMSGKQGLEFWNGILGVSINILAGLLLIPRYAAIGAGIATAIAISATHLSRLLQVYFTLRIWPYNVATPKILIASMISWGMTLILKNQLPIESVVGQVLVGSAIAAIAFFGVLLLLKLEPDDKEVISNVYRRFVGRKDFGKNI